MDVELGPGVSTAIGERVLKSAIAPFDEAGLDRGAYRSIIYKIGDEFYVSFVDKDYVYKRGHRGSVGAVPGFGVRVSEADFTVVRSAFSR